MVEKLTIEDRTNPQRCAERFAHGIFHGPGSSQYVRGDVIPMTEDMLSHLLVEVYSTGFDAGVAVERSKVVAWLRSQAVAEREPSLAFVGAFCASFADLLEAR
jgi:hypothetical protein